MTNTTALAEAAHLLAHRDGVDPATILAAFEAASRRHETPCGEGRIVWHAFGEGPDLALLHGGHGSWLHWLPVVPALAPHHRLLIPDLPGFGDSDDPPAMPRDGFELAEAVAGPVGDGLLALAASDTTALAGFSFGAVIATRIARRLGPAISHLVIVGAPGFGFPIVERPPLRRVRNVDAQSLEEVHRANLAAMMIADPANIDALAVHIQSVNVPRARTPSPTVSRTTSLRDALADVTAPITAIYGDADIVAPQHEERLEVLTRAQPGARQHLLPGVGHWAAWEGADALARVLLETVAEPASARRRA